MWCFWKKKNAKGSVSEPLNDARKELPKGTARDTAESSGELGKQRKQTTVDDKRRTGKDKTDGKLKPDKKKKKGPAKWEDKEVPRAPGTSNSWKDTYVPTEESKRELAEAERRVWGAPENQAMNTAKAQERTPDVGKGAKKGAEKWEDKKVPKMPGTTNTWKETYVQTDDSKRQLDAAEKRVWCAPENQAMNTRNAPAKNAKPSGRTSTWCDAKPAGQPKSRYEQKE